MFPFELTRPWLLLLALPLVGVVVYYFWRTLSDFPKRQRIVSLSIRLLVVVLIVLGLGGLTLLRPTQELFVVFVGDQSLSIGEEANAYGRELMQQASELPGQHRLVGLPFGKVPGEIVGQLEIFPKPDMSTDATPRDSNSSDATSGGEPDMDPQRQLQNLRLSPIGSRERSIPGPLSDTDRDGSNLAAAIETAAGYVPPGYVPRIVLLSDGNQTLGDAVAAAARSKVPVYTLPLPTRSDPEVQVSAVNVPAEVQEGAPFYVEVVIQSNHADEGLLEIFRGEHKVVSEKRKIAVGENRFRFQQSIERDRLAAFTVRLSGLAEDTLLDNNSETGLVYASGKPRVLIVESDPSVIRELAYSLEDEGIHVDVRPPQGMPASLADLQNYECVILSNVPATDLTTQQMLVTRTYVQELGGGFIMLGGEQSFGLGGYYKSPLEEILPVRSDFEKEKEKPSLGMVLVIDKSGSMSGDRIEMAKSAASAAVELLGRRDSVAVLAFDGDTYVQCEMQPASNTAKLKDEISRLEANGGTTMYPAMEMAYEMLLATQVKLKHAILLTDGMSSPGDFEGLAQLMASSKMTVSTVAVGDDSDATLLETIARVGKGRHYQTSDPSQVPQIFAKETVTASKSAIDEQPFIPVVVRATHALKDIDMEAAPFLLGYVMTRPKPTSEVILATEKGDPLLAWWRYGLGMTAAFTSDAKTRWAAEWMTWPGYGKFWTQVVRQTMRKSDTRGIQVDVERQSGMAAINVDAVNELGQFLNDAQVEMTVIQPGLKQSQQSLVQTAPGRYAGSVVTERPGAYHMEITVRQKDEVVYRQSRGMMVGYSDELRIRPADESLLQSVAEASGGKYAASLTEILEPGDQTATRPTPLWSHLLTAAAIIFLMDVALRRIDFSLHLGRTA